MSQLQNVLLDASSIAYERGARPLIFRASAQAAHRQTMQALAVLDRAPWFCAALGGLRGLLAAQGPPVLVGGVPLAAPLILAAGFVKGTGFATEVEALAAVAAGANIMPGWRAMPQLTGLVEFGSFTRHPRLGNPGLVLWREARTRSTQNRVGLRNPGAVAAATFLARHCAALPRQFGINIAVSPGVTDPAQETRDVLESLVAFLARGVVPAWFTLNLSCPNTDDDPGGRQTAATAGRLCGAVAALRDARPGGIPLWVKVGPELAPEQYRILLRVLQDVGARAIIATNTLARPTPAESGIRVPEGAPGSGIRELLPTPNPQSPIPHVAGVGGGRLHAPALAAVRHLLHEKARGGYNVDVIGCGGVLDGPTYRDYLAAGVRAVQYWSALVYRGPLAAAIIQKEAQGCHADVSAAGRRRVARY